MTRAQRSAALFLVMAAAALPALADINLNPLVTVLARPSGPVPADCETGVTTAEPRVTLGEPVVEASVPPTPPSNDLRAALRRLQAAAASDNYADFKTALAAARAAVAVFPPGGERNAANEAMAIYDDVERLWDYANNSTTGSFFDASTESGALLAMLNRYPGFGHAIADATMEVGEHTVYPARESRQFLAGEGAKKLTWMGAAPPAQEPAMTAETLTITRPLVVAPAPITPTPTPTPPRRIPGKLRPQPTTPTTTTVKTTATKKSAPRVAKTAPAKPKSAPVRKATTPTPKPAAEPLPIPAPVVAAPVPAPTPVPVPAPAPVPPPVTTTTAAPAPVPVPAPVATTTTTESVPVPTSTTPVEKPEATGGRINLLLALILIVVGLGVLIFLFRASD